MARKSTPQTKTCKRKRGAVARLHVEIDAKQHQRFTQCASLLGIPLNHLTILAIQQFLNTLPETIQESVNEPDTLVKAQPLAPQPQSVKNGSLPWLKVYAGRLLHGSTAQMPRSAQFIWLKLLLVASDLNCRDGILRYGPDQPIPRLQLAREIGVSVQSLNHAIRLFKNDRNREDGLPRLQEWDDGTLVITNFATYQAPSEGKRRATNEPYNWVAWEQGQVDRFVPRHPERARARLGEADQRMAELKQHNESISKIYKKA